MRINDIFLSIVIKQNHRIKIEIKGILTHRQCISKQIHLFLKLTQINHNRQGIPNQISLFTVKCLQCTVYKMAHNCIHFSMCLNKRQFVSEQKGCNLCLSYSFSFAWH